VSILKADGTAYTGGALNHNDKLTIVATDTDGNVVSQVITVIVNSASDDTTLNFLKVKGEEATFDEDSDTYTVTLPYTKAEDTTTYTNFEIEGNGILDATTPLEVKDDSNNAVTLGNGAVTAGTYTATVKAEDGQTSTDYTVVVKVEKHVTYEIGVLNPEFVGNVNVAILKVVDGTADHWLTKTELQELNLTDSDFVVTVTPKGGTSTVIPLVLDKDEANGTGGTYYDGSVKKTHYFIDSAIEYFDATQYSADGGQDAIKIVGSDGGFIKIHVDNNKAIDETSNVEVTIAGNSDFSARPTLTSTP
jgi:hypothetical protein